MKLPEDNLDRAYELFNSCGEKASKVELYKLLLTFCFLTEDEQCDLLDGIAEENSEPWEV